MISKHKSRSVTVGDTVFRHKVSATPQSRGIYRLNITIQSVEHNAGKLVVDGLIQKDGSVWPLTDYEEVQYYPTITRHEIERWIREAIRNGWDYTANGPSFVLQASNEIFRPDFRVTEPARNPTGPVDLATADEQDERR